MEVRGLFCTGVARAMCSVIDVEGRPWPSSQKDADRPMSYGIAGFPGLGVGLFPFAYPVTTSP